MSTQGSQAEFDFSAFDTEVTREAEDRIIEAIAGSINRLREHLDDDTLDKTFSRGWGEYVRKSRYTTDQLDPETLTKNRVIEPMLDSLGYEDYRSRPGASPRSAVSRPTTRSRCGTSKAWIRVGC